MSAEFPVTELSAFFGGARRVIERVEKLVIAQALKCRRWFVKSVKDTLVLYTFPADFTAPMLCFFLKQRVIFQYYTN